MIEYKRCIEVDEQLTYQGFKAGFADYMIKIEMPEDMFWSRFFGPEGNKLEHSFIALNGQQPVGVMLGGIRNFDGRKTIRCGGMCVVPEFRFRGVSVNLVERHQKEAAEQNCQQMFLEVIATNTPAVKFYKRVGYQKIYDLNYFFLEDMEKLLSKARTYEDVNIEKVSFKQLKAYRENIGEFHINWQNEMEYIERLENQHHYCIFEAGQSNYEKTSMVAILSINQSGQFHFLHVSPSERNSGLATLLLAQAVIEHQCKKIKAGFTANALLECYLEHIGFTRDKLSQYEMYLPVQ